MENVFTVKIDRKNLYARKYENKIYRCKTINFPDNMEY